MVQVETDDPIGGRVPNPPPVASIAVVSQPIGVRSLMELLNTLDPTLVLLVVLIVVLVILVLVLCLRGKQHPTHVIQHIPPPIRQMVPHPNAFDMHPMSASMSMSAYSTGGVEPYPTAIDPMSSAAPYGAAVAKAIPTGDAVQKTRDRLVRRRSTSSEPGSVIANSLPSNGQQMQRPGLWTTLSGHRNEATAAWARMNTPPGPR